MDRAALVAQLADRVRTAVARREAPVGIDGVDGAGKTVLAEEVVARLNAEGVPAWRVSLDGFHRPRAERYRQGRDSPSGFYEDTYDLDEFTRAVLRPLAPGGTRRVRTAAFDHVRDRPVDGDRVEVPPDGVVVVDGMFLHRPDLAGAWSFSVLLQVPFEETFRRMALRDGCPPDPTHPANRRYVEGQEIYLGSCRPAEVASVVVDNTDTAAPVVRRS